MSLEDFIEKAKEVDRTEKILKRGFIETQPMLTIPDKNERDHRIKQAFLILAREYPKKLDKHSLVLRLQELVEKEGKKVSQFTAARDLNYGADHRKESGFLFRGLPLLQCELKGTKSFYSANPNFLDAETLKDIRFLL